MCLTFARLASLVEVRKSGRLSNRLHLETSDCKYKPATQNKDNARLAQLVEQLVYTEKVGSSSLSSRTN